MERTRHTSGRAGLRILSFQNKNLNFRSREIENFLSERFVCVLKSEMRCQDVKKLLSEYRIENLITSLFENHAVSMFFIFISTLANLFNIQMSEEDF